MEKASQLQNQIRQNSTELNDFLKDLTRWEERVKDEDKNLKTARNLEQKLPPVRSKVKVPKVSPTPNEEKAEKGKGKPKRISSYDYDAWSKFDADAACKSDSDEENGCDSEEEEEEEEDAEEIERIQHQKSLQKAIMEKEKGNQLFKEGKYEAAINRYTSAIACDPSNPVLYANRGMALIKTEKYAAAEQDCNVALQLDPKYSKALARRGTSRKKLKKYKESLEDFTNLLELEPKNQQAIQEIKDIKKLLLTTNEGNSTKAVKNDEAVEPVKQRRRSNKPLKRIHITEIGCEEPSLEKIERTTLKSERLPVVVQDVEIPIPTTSFMFETEFKKLRKEGEKFYEYFKKIHLSDYGKLFYQCIDNLISPFINMLKDYYIRDDIEYHEELHMFSTVKRFDMAIMFLSRKDKDTLEFIITHLSSKSYTHVVEEDVVRDLSRRYNVRL